MAIEIIKFKSYEKNTLRAFLDVRLANGLEILGCGLHERDGQRWVRLPQRSYRKDDGTQGWIAVVQWVDKGKDKVFQKEILHAIDKIEEKHKKTI